MSACGNCICKNCKKNNYRLYWHCEQCLNCRYSNDEVGVTSCKQYEPIVNKPIVNKPFYMR